LEKAEEIKQDRMDSWLFYDKSLRPLVEKGYIEPPFVPKECEHNAHMFWLKVKNLEERSKLLEFLKINEVYAVFHYIPLHSSVAGLKFGRFNGYDKYTTAESERIIRLPMYYGLSQSAREKVASVVYEYFMG
jgi:dTDP-4-amino-4,6-dideoxygalactose transaminase